MNDYSLRYFQLVKLFHHEGVDSVLRQGLWKEIYPEQIAEWQSEDKLVSTRTLVPGEIVLEIARVAECFLDFYSDPSSDTLYAAVKGCKPSQLIHEEHNKLVHHEIEGVVRLTAEQAIREYGSDALWLADDYGYSKRGEKDTRLKLLDKE